MKKLLVLAIAVVALVGCKGAQSGTEGVSGVVEARQVGASDIAYIQMDSLVNNYNRYIDLGEAFEAKATKVQSELESRARRLENEMRDLEDKASKGLMTRSQIATTQEQIQQRATTYENDRQTLMTELADEEQV